MDCQPLENQSQPRMYADLSYQQNYSKLMENNKGVQCRHQESEYNSLSFNVENTIKDSYDNDLKYFLGFFSPKQTADSLQRRNDNLELLNFENSEEEPDQIYNRRKRKVNELLSKEQEQVKSILQTKKQNYPKYKAIINFTKLFYQIKQNLAGVKTDYYSTKTFCALKNSTSQDLQQGCKVMHKMYEKIKSTEKIQIGDQSMDSLQENKKRSLQFLIIPRFLISKQKLSRLIRDQELQENFQFLVINLCLGHYNNEANKKMPEQKQMKYIRDLMKQKNGREKFKKICSINHGSKFLKNYSSDYYQLYEKNIGYLRYLDNQLKKGKKYEKIKKNLLETSYFAQQQSESIENQNSSSSLFPSFKSLNQCLKNMEKDSDNNNSMEEENHERSFSLVFSSQSMKKGVRKFPTMPDKDEMRNELKDQTPRKFLVKKSATMQSSKSKNIILIPPPPNDI